MKEQTQTANLPKQLFEDMVTQNYFSLSDDMREAYGSYKTYREHYTNNHGLTPWLETLRNTELNEFWTHHVARMFVIYANRQPSELPSILASIARQYNVELPCIEGILTPAYWENVSYYELWQWTPSSEAPKTERPAHPSLKAQEVSHA